MKLGDKPLPTYRKTLAGFVPVSEAAQEFHRKTKLGDDCVLEGRRPRNLAHHAKFWALLTLVCQNQEHYQTVEEVCVAFKFAIGHTHKLKTAQGIVEYPASISFAAMDQTEFEAFYDRAITFLVTDVIPGLDRADLEREVLEWLK